jgi:hypothetical protein
MKTMGHSFLLLAFSTVLVHCDMQSGTGGRPVQFELQLETASPSERPIGEFLTSTGWHVKLEQAFIAVGPLYVYQNPPPLAHIGVEQGKTFPERFWNFLIPNAHAHAGDEHFFGGEVKGEYLGQIAFDVLNPAGVRLSDVPGTLGRAQSMSIWLAPPRTSIQGNASALHGHHAYVVGTATKEGVMVPFQGGLDIENEGTKQRVDGIPLDMQLDDGALLTLTIHPQAWFDAAHFDMLSEKNDEGRYVITPASQVRTAWFLGARGFLAFSTQTNQ